jgi:predicted RNase H-like HicB family nuclease
MKQFKIVVEKHPDTYVAYPLGLKGVVVGQGDSYEAALEDVKSAIKFHIDTFGLDEIDSDPLFSKLSLPKPGWLFNAKIPFRCSYPKGNWRSGAAGLSFNSCGTGDAGKKVT